MKKNEKESKKTKEVKDNQNIKEDQEIKKIKVKKARTKLFSFSKKRNKDGDIINLTNVNKTYTSGKSVFEALKNINLDIKKGSFTVILGKSGSGKSTLLNIISGLTTATSGEVIVNGENLISYKENRLLNFRAKNCSFIFQQYGLLSTLTVEENILTGENLYNKNHKVRKTDKKEIESIMKKIGIYEIKDKFPTQLSGGQQQRVSIARAIAKKPIILFGDEPTGAVDSSMTYNILKLLKEVNEERNITIVLITHDERIASIADHVINISGGTITSEVRQEPLKDFKKLFI